MPKYLVLRGALEHGTRVEVLGPVDATSEAAAINEGAAKRKAGGAYSAFPITSASLAHVKKKSEPTFTVEPVTTHERDEQASA